MALEVRTVGHLLHYDRADEDFPPGVLFACRYPGLGLEPSQFRIDLRAPRAERFDPLIVRRPHDIHEFTRAGIKGFLTPER